MADLSDLPLEPLRRLARSLIYDRSRAEDVVQEAWLAALRRDPEPESLRAWLAGAVRRIARSTGRDELRRAAREERAARPEAQPSAADATSRIEILRRLLDAGEALDEPYRTAIVLRFFDELPPRAIAKKLGLPVNTVRTHVRRGLERLRRDLDGERGQGRQTCLAALVPFAGRPWTLVLGAPSLSTPHTIGVLVLKNKVLAAALVLAMLGVSWVALRTLVASAPRQQEAVAALTARDREHAAVAPPSPAIELAPQGVVQREPQAGALTPSTATWIVRGHATRGAREPFPGLSLVGRVHAGPRPSGEVLLEKRFRADESGDFVWALEPPTSTVTVFVIPVAERHLTFDRWDVFNPGDPPPEKFVVFAYPLDVTVSGVVRDPEQRPVAGARVLHPDHVGTHPEDRETLTGEDGTFTTMFSSYFHEDTLQVVAAGFAQARRNLGSLQPGETTTPDLILERELRVHGRVIDEHAAPLSGARVGPMYPYDHLSTTTDENGSFELGTLPAHGTDRRLCASLEGYVQASVRLEDGQDEVEFRLERGARVSGRVRAESGASIAGAWLSVGPTPWPEPRIETWSDAEGRFALERVPAGDQYVWVWRTGFAELRHDLAVPDSGEALDGVEIVLGDDHVLGGTVLGWDGQPLSWAMVYAEDTAPSYPDHVEGFQTWTGAEGRFVIDGLPKMRVLLGVLGKGHARFEQEFDERDRDDLVLRPVRSAGLAGRVVDAESGAPIRAFVLRIVSSAAIPSEERIGSYSAEYDRGVAIRNDEGAWQVVEDWEPGRATAVEIRAEGYAPAQAERVETAIDPDPDACVIRLVHGTRVTGRVVAKENGSPIAGANVRCVTASEALGSRRRDDAWIAATTDSAGRFELVDVPTGSMSLVVDAHERSTAIDGPFPVNGPAPIERWIELGQGARIRGRLLDGAGHGLASEIVSAYGLEVAGEQREWTATTADDGAFVLANLPAGLFHVRWERRSPAGASQVVTDGRRLLTLKAYDLLQLVTLAPDEERELDLQPKGKATVRGTLRFAGELPAVVTVMFSPRSPPGEEPSHWAKGGRSVLAENGRFEATNVEAGTYTVMAYVSMPDNTLASGVAQAEVPEEGTLEVELLLEPRR